MALQDKKPKVRYFLTFILLIILFAVSAVAAILTEKVKSEIRVRNFDQCAESPGSIIRESYPRTCLSINGKSFTEEPKKDQNKQIKRPSPTNTENQTDGNCVTGGCNGEICQESSKEPVYSICLYKPEYECYKKTKCEKQQNGNCSWTVTDELIACLNQKPNE